MRWFARCATGRSFGIDDLSDFDYVPGTRDGDRHRLLVPRLPSLRAGDALLENAAARAVLHAPRARHHGRRRAAPRLLRAGARGRARRRGAVRILRRRGGRARASRVTAMSYRDPTVSPTAVER